MSCPMPSWIKNYRYTIGFAVSVALAIILFVAGAFDAIAHELNSYGYVSALAAGFLFPITFTSAAGALFLLELGELYNPIPLAILGGIGSTVADLLMFRFLKSGIVDELKALAVRLVSRRRLDRMERITRHRVFLWAAPFVASFLIASPVPDELGLALFSLINFKPKYLTALALVLNTVGIFFFVFLGYSLGRG